MTIQEDAEQLNMMVETLGYIDSVISELANEEYITEYFDYEDVNYLLYFSRHKYTFNIDLDYLYILIKRRRIRKIIDQGHIYDR